MNPEVIYYPREAVEKAVKEFETPFFLYEEKRLRDNCQRFKNAFTKYFPDFHPLYAVKANSNPDVLKIIMDEGYGFDSSSEAESWLTKKLGHWGMYTGNYTPASELKVAVDANLMLNLDDISMLDFLEEIGVPEWISFRINPGAGEGNMGFAGPDAKYGVPFEKAAEAYKKAAEMGVKKFAIHMMTGSNVCDEEYFATIVERLFEIVAEIKEKSGVEIEIMNIGGGFGVPYKPDEKSLDLDKVASGIARVFDEQCEKHGLKRPILMAEPGRYIAADMGFLVSKVCVMKDGYKKFVGIDASSNDMPRPSIYGAYHHLSVVTDVTESEVCSVVGRICENNDQFARDRELPICKIGDTVIIHNCGGHAFAMGHNYNGRPRHAEYLLTLDEEIKLIRKSETIEDLFKLTNL